MSHTTLNHQLPKSRTQLWLKPGPESYVLAQLSATISQIQGNNFNSDVCTSIIRASSPLCISITVLDIFMKQISINIRRHVIHKDFNSVLPLKKKNIYIYIYIYDPLKRKIVDFAIYSCPLFNRSTSPKKKTTVYYMVRPEIFSSNVYGHRI